MITPQKRKIQILINEKTVKNISKIRVSLVDPKVSSSQGQQTLWQAIDAPHQLADYSDEKPIKHQVEQAKKRASKLHGINFGRSLTLEQDLVHSTDFKSKGLLALFILGAIFLIFFYSQFEQNPRKVIKNKDKKKRRGKFYE